MHRFILNVLCVAVALTLCGVDAYAALSSYAKVVATGCLASSSGLQAVMALTAAGSATAARVPVRRNDRREGSSMVGWTSDTVVLRLR